MNSYDTRDPSEGTETTRPVSNGSSRPVIHQHWPEFMHWKDDLLHPRHSTVLALCGSGYLYKHPGDFVHKMNANAREIYFMKAAGDCCVPLLCRIVDVDEQGRGHTWGHITELATPFDVEAVAPEERAKVKDELIDLLERLHGRGIVHGDIKPENFLRCRDGTLRFCDFAEARWFTRKIRKAIGQPAHNNDKEVEDGGKTHGSTTMDNKTSPDHGDAKDADVEVARSNKRARIMEPDTEAKTKGAGSTESVNPGVEAKPRYRTRAVVRAEVEAAKTKQAEIKEANAQDTNVNNAQSSSWSTQGVGARGSCRNCNDCAYYDEYEDGWEGMATDQYMSPNRVVSWGPPTKLDDWYALAITLWNLYTRQKFGADEGEYMEDLLKEGVTVDIMAVKDEGVREYIKKILLAGGARICKPLRSGGDSYPLCN